jgi:small-conductance mechanosensitive channel
LPARIPTVPDGNPATDRNSATPPLPRGGHRRPVLRGRLCNVHGHSTQHKVIALAGTIAFVVAAVLALRSLAGELGKATRSRGGRSAGSAVEMTISAAGYILILILTLDLLGVSVQHLLLGGAIVGVVLGIALQQILANVFAGVVLLMAHPFSVGQRIRIKSGALGGELVGLVANVTLTYVVLELEDGPLNVPNAGVLAAAVGPAPLPASGEE